MRETKFAIDVEGWAVVGRMLLGLIGLYQVANYGFRMACFVMVLCVWADALTGWLARRRGLKASSTAALEIYADFLCFVILPMYFVFLETGRQHWQIWVTLPVFLLAAVYLLARFQVPGLVRGGGYLGMPVTYNGYLFPLFGLFVYFFPDSAHNAVIILIFVVSYLMVSTRLVIPEF